MNTAHDNVPIEDLNNQFHYQKKIPTENVYEIMTELMNEHSVIARNLPAHSCPFLSMLASFQSQKLLPVKVTVCPTGNMSDFLVTSFKTESHNLQESPDRFTTNEELLPQNIRLPDHSSKIDDMDNSQRFGTFNSIADLSFNNSSQMNDSSIKVEAAEDVELQLFDHTENPPCSVYYKHNSAPSDSQSRVNRKRGRPRKDKDSHPAGDNCKIPKHSNKVAIIHNDNLDFLEFTRGLPNSKHFADFPDLNGSELRCAVYGCNKTWLAEGEVEHVKKCWVERDKHIEVEHGDVSRECYKCQASFKTVDILFRHFKYLHPNDEDKPYVCCDRRFHTQWHISRHMSSEHLNSGAPKSQKTSLRAQKKDRAMSDCEKDNSVYSCSECPAVFMYKQHLTRHMSHHREPQFLCQFCSKSFRGERMLETHIANTHPSGARYSCSVCSHEFGSAKLLNYHVASQHTTRQCMFCQQVFEDYRLLREHKLDAHLDRQTIQCEECFMKFFSQEELKIHNARDHKEKPCPSCCEVFRNKKELEKHRRAHHKRPETHSCDKCNYECSTSYKMRRHLFTRHRIGSGVKCSLCDREFAEKCSLQVNI